MYISPLTDEYLCYASILTAKRQVFIRSFKSNTLQNKLARSTYLSIVKKELFNVPGKQ